MPRISKARRAEHGESRRAQILEAALRVWVRDGFHRAPVEAIAREAGVAKGTIYLYFPTKEAVLQAAIERFSLLPVIGESVGKLAETAPEQAIPAFVALVWQRLKERAPVFRVLLGVGGGVLNPENARIFFERIVLPGNTLLAAYLDHCIERGALRPTRHVRGGARAAREPRHLRAEPGGAGRSRAAADPGRGGRRDRERPVPARRARAGSAELARAARPALRGGDRPGARALPLARVARRAHWNGGPCRLGARARAHRARLRAPGRGAGRALREAVSGRRRARRRVPAGVRARARPLPRPRDAAPVRGARADPGPGARPSRRRGVRARRAGPARRGLARPGPPRHAARGLATSRSRSSTPRLRVCSRSTSPTCGAARRSRRGSSRASQLRPVVEEVAGNIARELDFARELASLERTRKDFAGDPDVRIPRRLPRAVYGPPARARVPGRDADPRPRAAVRRRRRPARARRSHRPPVRADDLREGLLPRRSAPGQPARAALGSDRPARLRAREGAARRASARTSC